MKKKHQIKAKENKIQNNIYNKKYNKQYKANNNRSK